MNTNIPDKDRTGGKVARVQQRFVFKKNKAYRKARNGK
jgi:hypothetical protein